MLTVDRPTVRATAALALFTGPALVLQWASESWYGVGQQTRRRTVGVPLAEAFADPLTTSFLPHLRRAYLSGRVTRMRCAEGVLDAWPLRRGSRPYAVLCHWQPERMDRRPRPRAHLPAGVPSVSPR